MTAGKALRGIAAMVAAVALPGTAMAAPAPVKLPPATAKPAPPFALTPGTRRITLSPELARTLTLDHSQVLQGDPPP